MNNLKGILEAILFVSGDAIEKEDILNKLNISEEELEKAIQELQEKYNGASGIHLLSFNHKLQLCSNSDYAEEVAEVLNPIRERKLSRAMLETMAIIAYKQPITRLEVENIRGVNSDYALQNLLKHNLIEVVGRKDVLGKPMLFGTTDEFLKRFELNNLTQLPDYEDLMKTISVIHERPTLYDEFEIPEEDHAEKDLLKQEEEFEKMIQQEQEKQEDQVKKANS